MSLSVASNDSDASLLAKAKLAFAAAGLGSGLGSGLGMALLSLKDWVWPLAVPVEPVLSFGETVLAFVFVVIVATGLGAVFMFIPTFVCWSVSQKMPFPQSGFFALLIAGSLLITIIVNRANQLPPFDPLSLIMMGCVGLGIALVRTRVESHA